MAKYTVACYAIVEYEIEADSPEDANRIAWDSPIDIELVKSGDCPQVLNYYWNWSDAMGSEVYSESGETVLCDW